MHLSYHFVMVTIRIFWSEIGNVSLVAYDMLHLYACHALIGHSIVMELVVAMLPKCFRDTVCFHSVADC
jgi:hypothetical protein